MFFCQWDPTGPLGPQDAGHRLYLPLSEPGGQPMTRMLCVFTCRTFLRYSVHRLVYKSRPENSFVRCSAARGKRDLNPNTVRRSIGYRFKWVMGYFSIAIGTPIWALCSAIFCNEFFIFAYDLKCLTDAKKLLTQKFETTNPISCSFRIIWQVVLHQCFS